MNNKLQELTDKLYNEGLSKGKQEAETLLDKAKIEAENVIAEAKRKAAEIEHAAKKHAEELKANADAEIKLAGRQIVNQVKQTVENLILSKTIAVDIKNAFDDVAFVQALIKIATEKFGSDASDNVDLFLLVPEERKKEFSEYIDRKVANGLGAAFDVKGDSNLKAGFKIGSKSGGYYISFTDEDFSNLFKACLRPKVSDLLFG